MGTLNIPNIENELKKIHAIQIEKKEVRANLFTLIIYVHEEERAKYLKEIVQNIIEKYPCRIIFIQADRSSSQDDLEVEVSSAHSNKLGSLVACDQINIKVSGSYINRVPYLILPHIVTDLPVYLLWGQDATYDLEILPHLVKLADRLIFDAECTKNLKMFSEAILTKKKFLGLELTDINWALCSAWRDLLFQTFYDHEHLVQLMKSKKIEITYNDQKSNWIHQPEMQSIYLQAWVASRLKWQLKGMTLNGAERQFNYEAAGNEVSVILIPKTTPSAPPGGVTSFTAESVEGYSFALQRDAEQSRVSVHCSSPETCELPYTLQLPNLRRGSNFMNEVFYSPPSPHYFEVLELLSKIE